MTGKSKSDRIFSIDIWRYLVNFWTLVIYIIVVADFFMRNSLVEFLGPICAIYIALLAVYTTQKEFERWHDENIGKHPGEVYVIVWTALIVVLIVLEIIYQESYVLPSEAFSTYVVVMGILAISRRSKANYCRIK
ncbi:MAG: hypothetical protein WCW47_02720 [Candidatus Paceibacterota bacterium]|jgi:hypothetical protein